MCGVAQSAVRGRLTLTTKGSPSPLPAPHSENRRHMTIQIECLGFHAWCDMTTRHDAFANFGNEWRWHSGPHRTNGMAALHFRLLCVIAAVRQAWLQFRTRGAVLPAASGRRIRPRGLTHRSVVRRGALRSAMSAQMSNSLWVAGSARTTPVLSDSFHETHKEIKWQSPAK